MLNYIDEYHPDYVVVSELSRLGRSNLTLHIIEKLTKMQICFISLKEGLKTLNEDKSLNPTTQLIIDILNGINKFELETIRYRVKSGLRKTANAGTWIGAVPFGYIVINQKLVINPNESETLKLMFEKFSEGWGSNKIASYLNR
jgi:site-specific DNA recombinase